MVLPTEALATGAEFAQGAVKVLSTDIVTLKGKFYRRVRLKEPRRSKQGAILLTKTGRIRYRVVERYEPIETEVHANPIGIGVLGVGLAAGAALLFGRLKIGVLGIGEIELYKGPLADEFDQWKVNHALRKGQQFCGELKDAFDAALKAGFIDEARQRWDEAHAPPLACLWTITTPRP